MGEARDQYGEWLARAEREDYHLSSASPLDARINHYPHPTTLLVDIHAGVELGLVLSGQMERHFKGHIMTLNPGEVWLCAMWEPHGWRTTLPETTVVELILIPEFLGDERFENTSWLRFFSASPDRRPRLATSEAQREGLAIGEELAAEISQKRPGWLSGVRFGLLRLLLLLHRQWRSLANDVPAVRSHMGKLTQILPALTLVYDRPALRISLEETADACSLSPSQFSRIFSQTMGLSFTEFRLRARLALAADRLLTTDLPASTIASEAGFAHASHLHRAFVKRYGCTPAAYRRRAR